MANDVLLMFQFRICVVFMDVIGFYDLFNNHNLCWHVCYCFWFGSVFVDFVIFSFKGSFHFKKTARRHREMHKIVVFLNRIWDYVVIKTKLSSLCSCWINNEWWALTIPWFLWKKTSPCTELEKRSHLNKYLSGPRRHKLNALTIRQVHAAPKMCELLHATRCHQTIEFPFGECSFELQSWYLF